MTMTHSTFAPPGGTATLAGHTVARIGFGAMQLPGPGVLGPPRDRDVALAVLRRAVELGVNHIDTAQFYGPNVSNELIHAALFPYADDLVLVSKVGATRDEAGGWHPAQRPEELRASVEENLASLGVEQVHVVNLRLHGDDPHRASGGPGSEFDDQVAEMVALRAEGKIGGIGLSTVGIEHVRRALPAGIACVQNGYSLLVRTDEPLLELCREHGVAWVPYFPLGSAFPGMPKVTENAAVVEIAGRLGATPAQVGLAWLLAHDEGTLLIPGTSSVAHLEENVAAGRLELDGEAMARLDPLGAPGQ
jgi:aryl-alcohol dehydrogenase-like predicted oxidoreductase